MYQKIKARYAFVFIINALCSISSPALAQSNDKNSTIEQAILADINSYRTKHHLTPLQMDARISKQAKNHSENMANHQVSFGHTNFLKRVSILHKEIQNSGSAAENVAFNYKDAHDVVTNWLQSPGHKKNIVGHYNLTGIGVARNAQGKLYFTQMFMSTGTPGYTARATTTLHKLFN